MLREDEEFRLTVLGLLGITDVQSSLRQLVSAVNELATGQLKVMEVLDKVLSITQSILEEIKKLTDNQNKLWEENNKIWQEIKAIKEENNKIWLEIKALRERADRHDYELSRLNRKLDALGARWGVNSEDAFRDAVKEFLSSAGYSVDKWSYFDDGGYVYGYPSQIDLDLVIKDNRLIVAEIKSSVSRGDLWALKRKVELYEMVTGVKVNEVYVITYYINERHPDVAKKMAKGLGIRLVEPEELTS